MGIGRLWLWGNGWKAPGSITGDFLSWYSGPKIIDVSGLDYHPAIRILGNWSQERCCNSSLRRSNLGTVDGLVEMRKQSVFIGHKIFSAAILRAKLYKPKENKPIFWSKIMEYYLDLVPKRNLSAAVGSAKYLKMGSHWPVKYDVAWGHPALASHLMVLSLDRYDSTRLPQAPLCSSAFDIIWTRLGWHSP